MYAFYKTVWSVNHVSASRASCLLCILVQVSASASLPLRQSYFLAQVMACINGQACWRLWNHAQQVTHMLAGCCTVTTTTCVRLEANGVPMHFLHTTGYLRHRRKTVQAGAYFSSTQDSTNVLAGWCPSHLQSYSNRWRRAFRVLGTWSCQWLCLWHLPYRPDYVQSGNKMNQINRGFKMSLQVLTIHI